MVTKQGFHSRVHLYDDLTISLFHFHFPFPVSIVSNFPPLFNGVDLNLFVPLDHHGSIPVFHTTNMYAYTNFSLTNLNQACACCGQLQAHI